jgi:hypothetical protein
VYLSSASIALLAAALLSCAMLLILPQRLAIGGRVRIAVLGVLVSVAFLAHLDLLRSARGGDLSIQEPLPHLHEIFHYYLGTKYFAELGYTGLYEATVLADFEDAPERFVPDAPVRDLTDNRMVDRATLLSASSRTRAAFDEARWTGFKRDLSILRDINTPEFWNARGYTVDHGYNATPLVTALLGSLANQELTDSGSFLGTVRVLDPYLLALVGVVFGALEGAVAALFFLFFLFANPMNEYAYVGGAYLRYNYLIALALALIALRQRWLVASGVFFAAAGWLRIFPLVFPGLLLLRDLAGPGWRARLATQAPLHASFAVTSLLFVAGSSFVATPDGRNAWQSFAETIAIHAQSPSVNRVALEVPFSYAPEKDRHREGRGSADEWVAETRQVLGARQLPFRIAQGVLVLAALFAMRRGPPEEVLLPGLLILFALTPMSHYYWAVLGLVPLAVRDPRRLLFLTLLFLGMALTLMPGLFRDSLDLCFTILSFQVLVFLLAMLSPLARAARATVIACAMCGLACSPADKPVDAPASVHERTLTGDVYRSTTLGVAISKTPEWSFLPETSLPVDGERSDDRDELWEVLDRPAVIPIVTFAAQDAGEDGPLVRLRAIPIRADDSDQAVALMTSLALEKNIRQALNPRAKHLDLTIKDEPAGLEVSGRKAAEMVVTYRRRIDEGSGPAVEERIVHFRRGATFFWLEMLAPAPVDASVAANFDRILASVQIDP